MAAILTIDTSGDTCYVVLERQGKVTGKAQQGRRTHGANLLPMIQSLLSAYSGGLSGIDALAVVTGPGSFTGIRIGVGVAQGLALGLGKPVISLSSLELLALAAAEDRQAGQFLVATDAREGEFYFGVYQITGSGPVASVDDCLATPAVIGELISGLAGPLHGIGNGWHHLGTLDPGLTADFSSLSPDLSYDADSLWKLANIKWQRQEHASAEATLPSYLKENMHYRQSS